MSAMDEEPAPDVVEGQVVDGLPVVAEVRELAPLTAPPPPALQTAAVAATGFLAGACAVALLQRRTARRVAPGRMAGGLLRPADGGRTYLVHVVSRRID